MFWSSNGGEKTSSEKAIVSQIVRRVVVQNEGMGGQDPREIQDGTRGLNSRALQSPDAQETFSYLGCPSGQKLGKDCYGKERRAATDWDFWLKIRGNFRRVGRSLLRRIAVTSWKSVIRRSECGLTREGSKAESKKFANLVNEELADSRRRLILAGPRKKDACGEERNWCEGERGFYGHDGGTYRKNPTRFLLIEQKGTRRQGKYSQGLRHS